MPLNTSRGGGSEGTKPDVASLVIVALPTRVAVSSYRGWKQADVDVKSHPQKLDMSGDSARRPAVRGNTYASLFLEHFYCLLASIGFILCPPEMCSFSRSDLHLSPPYLCHYFLL